MLSNQKSIAARSRSIRTRRQLAQAIEMLEARQLLAAHIIGSSTVYSTIQAAVNAAAANSIITVDAGTYNEQVTITKSLTLRGAMAGVDARSNTRLVAAGVGESIVTGINTGSGISSSFNVNANDVTLDGFIVQGETNQSTSTGAGIVIAPQISGTHILNNIIQNNVAGMFLANYTASDPAVIQYNVFSNNNNPGVNGGRGIYTDGGISGGMLTNVIIDSNYFLKNRGSTGTTGLEAAIALEAQTAGKQFNITITNNSMDYNGKAVLFFNTTGATISGNYITNTQDQYSGTLRFEGNNHNITITNNTVYDNTGPAVAIDAKGVPGDNSGFVVNSNNFYGNSLAYGSKVSVISDGSVYDGVPDYRYNFWGSASGPGGDGPGTGDGVYGIGHVVPGNQWFFATGGDELYSPWASAPVGSPTAPYYGLPSSDGPIIQAEDFDHGGEGYAYHDSTAGNAGGRYRPVEGVDIQATGDTGGGYNIYNTVAGEWLQYTVGISQAGTYNIDFRVANAQATGGTFHVEIDGVNVTGPLVMPSTGSYTTWQTMTVTGVSLPAGTHQLRIAFDANGSGGQIGNFNWFRLTSTGRTPPPATPSALLANASGPNTVNLVWTDNANNETGYFVQRKTGSNGTWATIASLAANATSYTDSTVSANTTYVYRVYATGAGGNSAYSNEASAITPSLAPVTYLSDMAWVSATNGWGPVELDMSVGGQNAGDGGTLTLNGVTYAKGLGTNAISDIVYNLGGQYGSFVSDIGVDDHQTVNGTVDFQVFADGNLIYDSGVMTPTSATQSLNLNMTGVQQLRLHVGDAGDGPDYDWADWAGARVLTAAPAPVVPAAPSGLSATAVSQSQINLAWNDVTGETGFTIERSTDGVNFTQIGTTAQNVTTYSDTGLVASTAYSYRVRATNSAGSSNPSNIASATTMAAPTAPAAPSNLTASPASASQINLSWTDNSSNETGFTVQRSADGSTGWTTIASLGVNSTSYSDTGLAAATQYFYRVSAVNAVGSSQASNVANATTSSMPSLPAGWSNGDIGNVGLPGSASYNNGTYTISGAGTGIGGRSDSFNFTSQSVSGDTSITARVLQPATGSAGVVIRGDLSAGAPEVALLVNSNGSVSLINRSSSGGRVNTTNFSRINGAQWLRLVRTGSSVSAYRSTNGVNWTLLGSRTLSTVNVFIGLAVTSKNTALTLTDSIDQVTVVP